MSSRFVSSGTSEAPTGSDEEWLAAQRAIEEKTIRKLNEGKQEGGKSLYEVLQANKEAKQEAFEESIKLKHQFRSLDENDIEFLDSITQKEKAREAEARHEITVQLESFRALREAAEKEGQLGEVTAVPVEDWSTSGRKRKKGKELSGIVKKRQISTHTDTADKPDVEVPTPNAATVATQTPPDEAVTKAAVVEGLSTSVVGNKPRLTTTGKAALGLGTYGSDDDDGDDD